MAQESSGTNRRPAEAASLVSTHPRAPQMQVIETASGFIIRNAAPGATPPAGPDDLSRAVNSDPK